MATWTIPRTARTLHYCGSCHRAVRAGDRYNAGAISPNSDLGNTGWWHLVECSHCAERYGRPVPAAGGVS